MAVPVGFIMARVDLGEFGRVETTAVIDTIGVDPDYQNKGVGRALVSQFLANLGTLRVEKVRTEVDWQDHDLLAYLDRNGFLSLATALFRPAARLTTPGNIFDGDASAPAHHAQHDAALAVAAMRRPSSSWLQPRSSSSG